MTVGIFQNDKTQRETMTVFHYHFLNLSETFIYRQLRGLGKFFDVKLITREVSNIKEFPGIRPIVIPKGNFWTRLRGKSSGREESFFLKHLEGSKLFHINFGHIALHMQHHARALGIPMTAYFLGVDASALLRDVEYCNYLKKSTFAAVFVNSEDMKRRLLPYLPMETKCYVAYCGIPLERFPFKHRFSVPEGATFLQVSRLDTKKGVDITLKAFSRYLKESDPKAKLIIAGDGPLKSELLRMSDSLGLSKSASFLGFIGYEKYIELLRNADVFIQPSVTSEDGDMEGIPTTICEAMACGLPVLSTRHSGIPEVVDDGVNGYLAEERDAEGLYARMALLRGTDVETMSRNARTKIEQRFDHNKTIAILADHMKNIIFDVRSQR